MRWERKTQMCPSSPPIGLCMDKRQLAGDLWQRSLTRLVTPCSLRPWLCPESSSNASRASGGGAGRGNFSKHHVLLWRCTHCLRGRAGCNRSSRERLLYVAPAERAACSACLKLRVQAERLEPGDPAADAFLMEDMRALQKGYRFPSLEAGEADRAIWVAADARGPSNSGQPRGNARTERNRSTKRTAKATHLALSSESGGCLFVAVLRGRERRIWKGASSPPPPGRSELGRRSTSNDRLPWRSRPRGWGSSREAPRWRPPC